MKIKIRPKLYITKNKLKKLTYGTNLEKRINTMTAVNILHIT